MAQENLTFHSSSLSVALLVNIWMHPLLWEALLLENRSLLALCRPFYSKEAGRMLWSNSLARENFALFFF